MRQISMDSSQGESLPPDMVFEILSRTALETMDACKVVCKEWKQLISHSTFMASYSKNTGNLIGYMVQNLVPNKHLHKFVSPYKSERTFYFSPFKFDDIKIEASSPQGILCCVRTIGRQFRYYVSKPCTNQWQPLPNPKCPHSTEKVALAVMSSSPLRYKIIRISEPRYSRLDCYDYRCQIFDSKTWAWKETEDVLLSRENRFDKNPAVYASGLVCILTNDYVLAFSLAQETPFTISLPQSPCERDQYSQNKKIVEHQGKLGLICTTSGKVELWVLKDWKQGRWEIIKRVNIDVLAKETSYPSPACFFNDEIILVKTNLGLLFWNLQDFSLNRIQHGDFMLADDIFPFRSDWDPVNLREKKFSVQSKKFKKFSRTHHMSVAEDEKNLLKRQN